MKVVLLLMAAAAVALFLLLRRRRRESPAEPAPEAYYVCPHCNDHSCVCHKESDSIHSAHKPDGPEKSD